MAGLYWQFRPAFCAFLHAYMHLSSIFPNAFGNLNGNNILIGGPFGRYAEAKNLLLCRCEKSSKKVENVIGKLVSYLQASLFLLSFNF